MPKRTGTINDKNLEIKFFNYFKFLLKYFCLFWWIFIVSSKLDNFFLNILYYIQLCIFKEIVWNSTQVSYWIKKNNKYIVNILIKNSIISEI